MVYVSKHDLRELMAASDTVTKVRRDLEQAEKRVTQYRAQLQHAETQLDNAIRQVVRKYKSAPYPPPEGNEYGAS